MARFRLPPSRLQQHCAMHRAIIKMGFPVSKRKITPIGPPPVVSEEASPVMLCGLRDLSKLTVPTGQVGVVLSAVLKGLQPGFCFVHYLDFLARVCGGKREASR